jgi:hypothetical protein
LEWTQNLKYILETGARAPDRLGHLSSCNNI